MAIDHELIAAAPPEPDELDMPTAGASAIRGSLLRTVGYVAGILLSLVAVPLLFAHLGDSDYGRYVAVIALVAIVQGVTDVGLGQIGVREFATRSGAERERLMRNLLGVRFTLTAVGVGLATGFAALAPGSEYGRVAVIGTLVAGVGMVLTVVQGTFAVPLAARLRLGWVTLLDLLRQVLSVAGIVILVLAGARLLPFLAISVPVSIAVLAATVLLVRGTMPLRPSFELAEWSLLIRSVLPFAAAVVVATLYLRITVVLTSVLTSHAQIGYYGISFTVISVLIAIPALTVGSTLPVLARAARDDAERLRYVIGRLVDVTLIVGVGLGLGLAVGAGFVIHVLTSGTAAPATDVLRIQSLAVVTNFIGAAPAYGLLVLHRHRSLLLISAVGLVVSVGLTLALVPALQARGAATAFSAGEFTILVLLLVGLRMARPDIKYSPRVPLRVLMAALLGGAVTLVPGLSSFVDALIAGVVYMGVLVVSGAIPPELTQALLRRPQPLAP
jgi:O-antigen/teichoic acid export membrane protein